MKSIMKLFREESKEIYEWTKSSAYVDMNKNQIYNSCRAKALLKQRLSIRVLRCIPDGNISSKE